MARDDSKVLWPYVSSRQAVDREFALRVRFRADVENLTPATIRVDKEGEPILRLSDAAKAVFERLDPTAVAARLDDEDARRWTAEFERARGKVEMTMNQACRLVFGPHFHPSWRTYSFNSYVTLLVDPTCIPDLFSPTEEWPTLEDLAESLRERPSERPSGGAEPDQRFTWVPFYEELARKLVLYRHRQTELIELLERLRGEGLTITPLNDRDSSNNPFLLREIDPFTFFGTFNRGLTREKRIQILRHLREFFGVVAAVPSDFDGIPILNNQSSWFISYSAHRKERDVERLWDVFELGLDDAPLANPAFGPAFDAALEVRGTKVNLTMGLFWIRPRALLSVDSTMREHLEIEIPNKGLSYAFYKSTLGAVRESHGTDFVALSHQAYVALEGEGEEARRPKRNVGAILASDTQFWMVGAFWDGRDMPDQTARFLAEGIWENGYEDRYLDLVREMKPGDRIAIKAATTQQHGLPFENNGKTISRLIIKARGTVIRNANDGRAVFVEWEPQTKSRDWYFYTGRSTVWRLRKEEDYAKRLIRFVFFDEPQDYAFFTRAWWDSDHPPAPPDSEDHAAPPYSAADVLAEGVFLTPDEVELALRRLTTKKLLILQGAPGVGKTFVARKLAYALMEARDDERIEVLQFHPSFTYEDFVRGIGQPARRGSSRFATVRFCACATGRALQTGSTSLSSTRSTVAT